MTTNFTASNGIQIFGGTGYIKWSSLTNFNQSLEFAPTSDADEAFAEWYQHRRDTELGRWRDPEAPDVVVYHLPSAKREATGRTVRVLDERLGAAAICNEHLERSSDPTNAEPTAKRYFAAHPEPREWENAQPGDVWLLTIDGKEHPAQTIVGRMAVYPHDAAPEFFIPTLTPVDAVGNIREHTWSPTDPGITAGRKLWPVESDDE